MVHALSFRAVLVLLGISLLAAMYPLLLGRFYLVGDMHDVFLPLEDFFREELLSGRLPLWDPDIAWGFPVIASAQIGFLYPPLLLVRWLPLVVYLPLILFTHVLALGAGTYLLARRLAVSRAGALLSALCLMLSGFIFQHLTHLNVVLTVAWLPWQFLAWQRLAAASRPRPRDYALAAGALAAPYLAGHLHLPFVMTLIGVAYYLSRPQWWRGRRPRHLAAASRHLLIVGGLALALAAAQVVPTLELVTHSSRGVNGDFDLERANQLSWPLYHAPTILFPRFFGADDTYWGKRLELEYGIFIGTLPLLLAAAAWRTAWRRQRFFVIAATVGFLLALGDASPFRLLGLEPSLWYFSAPARWLLLYTFAMSILAGVGFDTLRAGWPRLRRPAALLLGVLAAAAIIYNLAIWNLPDTAPASAVRRLAAADWLGERPTAYYEDKIASLITSMRQHGLSFTSIYTWLPLVTLAAAAGGATHRRAPQIVLAVTALELVVVAATTVPTVPWAAVLPPPAAIAELPPAVREGQARILSRPWPGGDTGLYLTNPASRPTAATREHQRQLLLPASHARFNIAGTQWPASLDLTSHARGFEELSLPELNIGVVVTETAPDQPITIEVLFPRPRVELVVGEHSLALPYRPTSPTNLSWHVTASAAGQLIVRDTFYPGWQATVDHEPAPLLPYQSVFRQVAVPAGKHDITMMYRPRWLYGSLALSSATACTLAALAWSNRWRITEAADAPDRRLAPPR